MADHLDTISKLTMTAPAAAGRLSRGQGQKACKPPMPDYPPAETILIATIEAHARQRFPEAAISVRRIDPGEGWVLLVNDDGKTHQFTAATLDELHTKSEGLLGLA